MNKVTRAYAVDEARRTIRVLVSKHGHVFYMGAGWCSPREYHHYVTLPGFVDRDSGVLWCHNRAIL